MDEPHVIPWGSGEVARALGVATATVQQWRFRGIFPDPDIRQGARNFWWPQTVIISYLYSLSLNKVSIYSVFFGGLLSRRPPSPLLPPSLN